MAKAEQPPWQRQLAEQQRLYDFRLDERLFPYEAKDPLFVALPALAVSPVSPAPQPAAIGPTVRETVDRYLKAKKGSWAAKTPKHRARQLDLLVEHLGAERRLATVTRDDMRTYRDGVLRFRRNHHTGASLTFVGRQTDNEALRITPRTALIQFQNVRSFLRWCVAEGYIEADPSAHIQVEQPKKAKTTKPRRPFSAEEIATLFGAPMFTGFKSRGRRHLPGTMTRRDAQFWIPVLGYYTGARMGELVQLHVSDIHLAGPHPYIDITDAGGGEVGTGTEKHVKSAAGIRKVPIHPHLIDLGFLEFVTKRAGDKRASSRLFYEIEFGQDGQASSTYSKRFARLMDNCGLTDPALCFHSFRHLAKDALRDALQPPYVIDRIIGHAEESETAHYGEGISLEVATDAIKAMKLPYDLREILKSSA